MSNLCIITARGGSKRIPRKNIRNFLGKPIIAYSIEAALASGLYDEVMVSTEDEEIAEISRQYGAEVPFMRSAATASDFATTRDVLLEVLDEYEKRGKTFEYFTCIYPTAPFVTAEKLKAAYSKLINSDADELIPVIRFSFPPQRAFVIRDNGLEFQYPEYYNTRSQDLEPIYHDCGQFYLFKTDIYRGLKEGSGRIMPLIVPEEETQDIDNYSDWEIAEVKYERFILKKKVTQN